MKLVVIALFGMSVLLSCSTAPEPLAYGKDGCYACKMTLMDNKFGAELVTKKGKIYKFDDVNCLMNFYKSDYEPAENIAHVLVVDFANPGQLIDALNAYYVHDEGIRSPMASNVAAFLRTDDVNKFNAQWDGQELKWNELKEKLK